ncbi:nuclear transport factor 2 family protein [Sphingomonas cavernae]
MTGNTLALEKTDRLAIVERLMERYNAHDADGYADMFAEHGSEAMYRGDVLREGREGVREGLRAMFAEFPRNHAEVRAQYVVGNNVVLHEVVRRAPEVEPFEVVSIYSFSGGDIERVEFVR